MITQQRDQLGDLLEQVAKSLDIPDHLHAQAIEMYGKVGKWLEHEDEALERREPEVYAQGSFALGTVVRPISDEDEFDIDLVYERDLRKSSVTQEQLKEEAGDHLESYVSHCEESDDDVPELEPKVRCWRLDYNDQFHMDVLPAIPDDVTRRRGTPASKTSILITDTDLRQWQHSNPRGYLGWFKSRMAIQFNEKRAALALEMKAAADQVPDYKVKTPLQRAIQILKRHRDVHFIGDEKDRPVSIVLTTLAATSYDNQSNLVDALLAMVREMPKHIQKRNINGEAVSWVVNPVNDKENFADKWQKYPEREKKFRAWLRKLDNDLGEALRGGGIHKVIDLLKTTLGHATVNKAAAALGVNLLQTRQSGGLKMTPGTGTLGTTGSVPVKDHTFYGMDEE